MLYNTLITSTTQPITRWWLYVLCSLIFSEDIQNGVCGIPKPGDSARYWSPYCDRVAKFLAIVGKRRKKEASEKERK